MINIIAAVNTHGIIGKNGTIPWHCPEDLKFFHDKTFGGIVIMGRKTFESIRNPLHGRLNIVISSTLQDNRVQVYRTLQSAISVAKNHDREIWIAGGRDIYAEALSFADRAYISHIPDNTPNDHETTVMFPWLDLIEKWIVKEQIKNPYNELLRINIFERME